MSEKKVDLNKSVFSKQEYSKIINTDFSELGVTNITEDIQNTPTVDDFFILYDQLFYEIPERGDSNSHEFLVQTSGEYINFQENNEEIQALREEITQLRQSLLDAQIQNVEIQTNQTIESTQIEELKNQIDNSSNNNVLENLNNEISNS
jgi:hypothetical protein